MVLGCRQPSPIDPLKRSRVDGLNREAFVNRYRDPALCLAKSTEALAYISDSLPAYADGRLRARNNMAFAYYQMSDAAHAAAMLDSIDSEIAVDAPTMQNGDIEWVISSLIEARMLQRNCQIADSYRLLYDIGQSGVLRHNRDNLLYNYALTEYYITMLTLNFHYRDGKQSDVRELIGEVEEQRASLKVDYAQDMALNYALAYGLQTAGECDRALDYCDRNFDILALGDDFFCPFQYANTLQMTALAMKSMPGMMEPDSILAMYDEARRLFFDYGDPYQMLGGVTSTARYALLIGDTAKAHEVLAEWHEKGKVWTPFSAPKMELGLFDVLIRSRFAKSPDDNRRWYEHRSELQDYITRNEKEDFVLQNSLSMATRRNTWMTWFAVVLGALLLALVVLVALLLRNAARLKKEKAQMEEANRRDVERIANVETCLSVMRHDISPFIGYLRNPDLPDEVRDEVLEQLLRTFDNLKNWTHLSIPSGLAFSGEEFALNEVTDEVSRQVIRPKPGVTLHFEPNSLKVWADRQLLVILLRNLVNNALQHTTEGTVTVSATPVEGQGMVDIEVADTGCGLTAEQCDSLFRADREVAEGAEHGFGLILCRYIIKRHDDNTRRGCKIWVTSQPGAGTTMHCRIATKQTS